VSVLNRSLGFLRLWILFGSTIAAAVCAADIVRDGVPQFGLTMLCAALMLTERARLDVRAFFSFQGFIASFSNRPRLPYRRSA
jgi:hypothetical protein